MFNIGSDGYQEPPGTLWNGCFKGERPNSNLFARARLLFIDIARGIVMILMAWDHVSGFRNPGKMGSEGLRGYLPIFFDFTQFARARTMEPSRESRR